MRLTKTYIYTILLVNIANSFKSKTNGGLSLKTVFLAMFLSCRWLIVLVVFMIGVWKDVKGYEGLYQVSDMIKVRSLDRMGTHWPSGLRLIKGRMLKQVLGGNGYLTVCFCNGSGQVTKAVHRLVAEAFIPNPNNYPEVNHKNGIKSDNRTSNLEWCDRRQNAIHSFKIGLQSNKGEKHPQAKLTNQQVVCIKTKLQQGYKCINLAKKYGVSGRAIQDIKNNKTWSHINV